jgi:solute carrier family 25 (mitochondrial phosphate transporter), member 23/24/25/41
MMDVALHESIWKVKMARIAIILSLTILFTGDVSLSAEDKPPSPPTYKINPSGPHYNSSSSATLLEPDDEGEEEEYDYFDEDEVEEEEQHQFLEGHTAIKFLFAGGVAGAGE